jgi:F-type H+-transporting ATPase subunit b
MRVRFGGSLFGIHGTPSAQGRERQTAHRVIACLIPCLCASLVWLAGAHASGGGEAGSHEGPNWLNFFWRSVNFLALAGVCYWLMAKKVKAFFAGRRDGIRTALTEAASAREAAEKKFEEYSAKLDTATGEIDQLGAMIRSQGLAEKVRIIDDARKVAAKMKEDTQARMDQEFSKAAQQLRVEAVRLATAMAEELLRKHIRAADHEAVVKDYIEKVVNKN